jgi:hypothetical protein
VKNGNRSQARPAAWTIMSQTTGDQPGAGRVGIVPPGHNPRHHPQRRCRLTA